MRRRSDYAKFPAGMSLRTGGDTLTREVCMKIGKPQRELDEPPPLPMVTVGEGEILTVH